MRNGGAAFPVTACPTEHPGNPGMSLRDYFAGQALSLLGHQYSRDCSCNLSEVPHEAYLIADAMLAERQKGQADGRTET